MQNVSLSSVPSFILQHVSQATQIPPAYISVTEDDIDDCYWWLKHIESSDGRIKQLYEQIASEGESAVTTLLLEEEQRKRGKSFDRLGVFLDTKVERTQKALRG